MSIHIVFNQQSLGDFMYLPIDIIRMVLLNLPPTQCFQIISPLNQQFYAIVHDYLFKKLLLKKLNSFLTLIPHRIETGLIVQITNTCYECGKLYHSIHPFFSGIICIECREQNVKYAFFSKKVMEKFLYLQLYTSKKQVHEIVYLYTSTARAAKYNGRQVYKFSPFYQFLSSYATVHLITLPDDLIYNWMKRIAWC